MSRNSHGNSRAGACALLCASLGLLATGAEAQQPCARTGELDFEAAEELVAQRFASGDYDCAAALLNEQAHALLGVAGRDGFDARFSLRELALSLLAEESRPIAERVRMLTAAAAALDGAREIAVEDIEGDLSMLAAGAEHLWRQRDFSSWLALFESAVVVDQRHPDGVRSLPTRMPGVSSLFSELGRKGEIAQLVSLATLVRDDAGYDGLRRDLTAALRYNAVVWRERDPPEAIRARCEAVLRLVDLLTVDRPCATCPADWRWQPLISVGTAYFRLGMPDAARTSVDQGLRAARSLEDPEHRVGSLNLAFGQLLVSRYDSDVVVALANETLELANSLDTPLALEIQNKIPQALRNAGLSER